MRYTTRKGEEIAIEWIDGEIRIDGGQGSGNFGHAGRKGQRGGSAKENTNTRSFEKTNVAIKNLKETLANSNIKEAQKDWILYNLDKMEKGINYFVSKNAFPNRPKGAMINGESELHSKLKDNRVDKETKRAIEKLLNESGYFKAFEETFSPKKTSSKNEQSYSSMDISDTLTDLMGNYSPSAQGRITQAIEDINNAEDNDDIISIIEELENDVLFNYKDLTTLTNVVNKLE